MPLVKVAKRGGKYRLVEVGSGRIAKTKRGRARDGGGHRSRVRAEAQKGHINRALKRKGY